MKGSLAEMSVIGGLAIDGDQCGTAFALLKPEMFENNWLREVFTLCVNMHQAGERIDAVSIDAKMDARHREKLVRCADLIPGLVGYDGYCAVVLEDWRKRSMIADLSEITFAGPVATTSKEIVEKLEMITARQRAIENALNDNTSVDFWGGVMRWMDDLQRPSTDLKSGWGLLDQRMGGFRRKGFYIISGRSGQGKTDFALSLACNMAAKYRVTYCTMEMPTEQLMERVASRLAHVDSSVLRDKKPTPDQMEAITKALSWARTKTQLTIDEQPRITVEDVENKILRHNADVIFIDHIGLMGHAQRKNHWESVADTSQRLKELANKHNVVIIALVQEGRSANKAADNTSLKGSDNLANDADGILQMRSEPPKEFITGDQWIDAEVHNTKNRHGGCGVMKYYWWPQYHDWRQVDDRR